MERKLETEVETIELGRELSLFSRKGLAICLFGDLGAGKTTLARSLIQELSGEEGIADVPSPTFSLLQPYEDLRIPVHHYDLYRINQIDEVFELGLYDDLETRLTVIEWPERLEGDLPPDRIDVFLNIENDHRVVKLQGYGIGVEIVSRMDVVANFLDQGVWSKAIRRFLQGDASARRYERLTHKNGNKALLMDMPEAPCSPITKGGKTYSEIAHIAQGIAPVAAVNSKLLEMGFSAPRALQQDLENGLMIIEDFGDIVFGAMIHSNLDITQPIKTATQLLAEMAFIKWPMSAGTHKVADFDFPAFQAEVELLLDWFWPLIKDETPNRDTRETFVDIWTQLFQLVQTDHPVWILRDFHSPNLIWMPERQGTKRVGLIDTQDCVLGHPAYDLVSMLQDARVDLPDGFEAENLEYYCQLRLQQDSLFDAKAHRTAYAVFGAQRATKILGIFARLYKRDGKPAYLAHIPRVSGALAKNLTHPALTDLAKWYNENLPAEDRIFREPT